MLEVQLNECLGDLLADTPSYTLFQIAVGSRLRVRGQFLNDNQLTRAYIVQMFTSKLR